MYCNVLLPVGEDGEVLTTGIVDTLEGLLVSGREAGDVEEEEVGDVEGRYVSDVEGREVGDVEPEETSDVEDREVGDVGEAGDVVHGESGDVDDLVLSITEIPSRGHVLVTLPLSSPVPALTLSSPSSLIVSSPDLSLTPNTSQSQKASSFSSVRKSL